MGIRQRHPDVGSARGSERGVASASPSHSRHHAGTLVFYFLFILFFGASASSLSTMCVCVCIYIYIYIYIVIYVSDVS